MMPKSTKDRFLVFVEKPKASIKELREQFQRSDYSTKTSGYVAVIWGEVGVGNEANKMQNKPCTACNTFR